MSKEAGRCRAGARATRVILPAHLSCAADSPGGAATASREDGRREAMVREQMEARGIRDRRVLDAIRAVPRHRFVADECAELAYADRPLPIGHGQTISQPFIVAFMAEALHLRGDERVLEVGSGSGYAAAVLSHLVREVYGIELDEEIFARSAEIIAALGYANVHLRAGDGYHGWPEEAPFDAILMSCAAEGIPPPLWDQLAPGGRFLYPEGSDFFLQELVLAEKAPEGPRKTRLELVRFVPMRRGR